MALNGKNRKLQINRFMPPTALLYSTTAKSSCQTPRRAVVVIAVCWRTLGENSERNADVLTVQTLPYCRPTYCIVLEYPPGTVPTSRTRPRGTPNYSRESGFE